MIKTKRKAGFLLMMAVGSSVAPWGLACSSGNGASTLVAPNDSGTVAEAATDGPLADSAVGDTSIAAEAGDAAPADAAPADGAQTDGAQTDSGLPPLCSTLPGTVVYIESGDTQEPLLKALGRSLRDDANITLAFQLTGSCTLSPNLYGGTPIPKNTNMLYIPSTAESPTWTVADAESVCTTSSTAGTEPDLGIAALFPSSCAGVGSPPDGIGTFIGPIQAYTFIVPTAEFTTQTAISAEEAYYALGDGANNPVTYGGAPEWNVPAQFFLRPASKSTLVATALNIGLTAKQATLVGADGGTTDGRNLEASSSAVLAAVAASTSLQALGILGDEIYDANRGKGVNVLAFQAFGQNAAYYPDSTVTSFDKQNIRDGRYSLWSPTVYIAPVDDAGAPSNPAVKYVTDSGPRQPGRGATQCLRRRRNTHRRARCGRQRRPHARLRDAGPAGGRWDHAHAVHATGTLHLRVLEQGCECGHAARELRRLLGERPLRDGRVPERLLRGAASGGLHRRWRLRLGRRFCRWPAQCVHERDRDRQDRCHLPDDRRRTLAAQPVIDATLGHAGCSRHRAHGASGPGGRRARRPRGRRACQTSEGDRRAARCADHGDPQSGKAGTSCVGLRPG